MKTYIRKISPYLFLWLGMRRCQQWIENYLNI